jgi:hypothetical protein
MSVEINPIHIFLIALGIWIVFDGIVSLTYFAWFVDNTKKNVLDQAIRIVRIIVGVAVIIIGLII